MEIERDAIVFSFGTYDFNNVKVVKKKAGAEEENHNFYTNSQQSLVTVENGVA